MSSFSTFEFDARAYPAAGFPIKITTDNNVSLDFSYPQTAPQTVQLSNTTQSLTLQASQTNISPDVKPWPSMRQFVPSLPDWIQTAETNVNTPLVFPASWDDQAGGDDDDTVSCISIVLFRNVGTGNAGFSVFAGPPVIVKNSTSARLYCAASLATKPITAVVGAPVLYPAAWELEANESMWLWGATLDGNGFFVASTVSFSTVSASTEVLATGADVLSTTLSALRQLGHTAQPTPALASVCATLVMKSEDAPGTHIPLVVSTSIHTQPRKRGCVASVAAFVDATCGAPGALVCSQRNVASPAYQPQTYTCTAVYNSAFSTCRLPQETAVCGEAAMRERLKTDPVQRACTALMASTLTWPPGWSAATPTVVPGPSPPSPPPAPASHGLSKNTLVAIIAAAVGAVAIAAVAVAAWWFLKKK